MEKKHKNVILGLIALNCFAISLLLIVTLNNVGPLYELLQPDTYSQTYVLDSQYIGSIDDDSKHYYDVLILDVTEYDAKNDILGDSDTLYFANENKTLSYLNNSDIIVIMWVKQKLDDPYVYGIHKYNDNILNINTSMLS